MSKAKIVGRSPGIDREIDDGIDRALWAEFDAAARRPLALRMKYAFIKTYKPVMDDEAYRSFETTAQYRQWCEENLPQWLGYGRV